MKKLFMMALALVAILPALAQGQEGEQLQERRYTMYGVMFYNLENLFDTINNNGQYDFEFSPQGARQWNGTKYWQKQHNMAYAISQMEVKGSPAEGPVLIGVSEIENITVLQDLVPAATRLFITTVLTAVVWMWVCSITRASLRCST